MEPSERVRGGASALGASWVTAIAAAVATVTGVAGLFIGNTGAFSVIMPGSPEKTIVKTLPAITVTVTAPLPSESGRRGPGRLNASAKSSDVGDWKVTVVAVENRACSLDGVDELCGQVTFQVSNANTKRFELSLLGESSESINVIDSSGSAHTLVDPPVYCGGADEVRIGPKAQSQLVTACFDESFATGDQPMSASLNGRLFGGSALSLAVTGIPPVA